MGQYQEAAYTSSEKKIIMNFTAMSEHLFNWVKEPISLKAVDYTD